MIFFNVILDVIQLLVFIHFGPLLFLLMQTLCEYPWAVEEQYQDHCVVEVYDPNSDFMQQADGETVVVCVCVCVCVVYFSGPLSLLSSINFLALWDLCFHASLKFYPLVSVFRSPCNPCVYASRVISMSALSQL